jgi:dipeptidyl aminopeptidase/acylaminoacyl peptidase
MVLAQRRFSKFLSLFLLVALGSPLAFAAAPAQSAGWRPITHEDVWLMKRMGAMAVSPDGRWIVMSVSEPAYDDAQKGSDLWIVPSDGSAPPRRLTSGKAAEGSPVFSPDSRRIAFVAKREGDDVSQIYVLELAGGEAQRATNWATGARSPLFSPDGRTMLFVSETFPGARTDEENRKALAERKARKYVARAYDSFPIRHWDRWLDELRPTLVVQSLDTEAPARDLLAGTALRQGRGYGGRLGNENDALDAAWTPDGRGVVFAATTNRNEAARADVYASLWQVSLDGGEPRRLTADQGDYSSPKFTDDGRTLLAKVQPRSEQHVYVADRLARWTWPSLGDARVLTAGFDGQVAEFEPAPDSAHAFFLAEHHGHQRLYKVALKSGAVSEVGQLDAGSYAELAVGGPPSSPVVATVWASASIPHEAGRVNLASGRWASLTSFNSAQAAALALPPIEEFWFTSSRGKRIHNFVVRPPGFDPQKKYPLFVVIHGGPHSMFRDEFVLRWNYHLLAQPGYVVLMTNYSGSTGFGEAFAQSIQGDPLEGPAKEINEAADEAIRRYAFVDGSRQAAGGGSYGGHLANWLAVSTDRYKALVSHAGLYDLKTQWTTSDVVYSRERNIGGPAWEQIPLWREQSPFYRSPQLRAPLLLTAGERDFRVPVNNAIETWTVLQRQDVPSRLVVFPDENHWIQKGENSRYFYQEIRDWLAKYL